MPAETCSTDVVVVGAGPAGSTAAAILARHGWDVLLVDRAGFPRDKTCGDGLTPRAIPVLERLGLLPALKAGPYQMIHGACLHAPDGTEWHLRFADHDLGLPPFGLVVPRRELDHRLCQHAVTQGAKFRPDFHVAEPVLERGVVVGIQGLANGQRVSVRARLTIIATGASIGLLRAFRLLAEMPPGINAIRGYFTGVPDLADAFEFYFDPELSPGYAWIFPVADGRANIGLGVLTRNGGSKSPNLRKLLAEFLARHARLQAVLPASPAKSYPLRIDFPRCRPAGPGFLVIGEALGLANPVTGEGIDLALESAELAAGLADVALRGGNMTERGLTLYTKAVRARYASFFRGIRLLLRLATGPRAINVLVRQASHKPHLAHIIAGINLGVVSPWTAFSPRTWWDILT